MKLLKFLLFNRFTHSLLKELDDSDNKAPERLKAFLLDTFYTFSVFFPVFIIFLLASGFSQELLERRIGKLGLDLRNIAVLIPTYGLCVVSLNKDFYNAQSIVNRYSGYQVVDIKTGLPADSFKCMLRNLTGPIAPLEMFFVLFNRERRIGDFIAGTKLIKVDKSDPKLVLDEMAHTRWNRQTKLALLIPTLLFAIWVVWGLIV